MNSSSPWRTRLPLARNHTQAGIDHGHADGAFLVLAGRHAAVGQDGVGAQVGELVLSVWLTASCALCIAAVTAVSQHESESTWL
jgi:hypothetical protein